MSDPRPSAPVLLTEDRDAVRIVTLNRPEKLNALNTELTRAVQDALLGADEDAAVRAVVLAGAGRAFCAGADLQEFGHLTPDNAEAVARRADLTLRTQLVAQRLSKPVVSVVQGAAVGGGAGLAIGADMVVAADDVRFGYPEVRHSIVPALVMTGLQRQVGRKLAFELVSTGRMLGAEELLSCGLANEIASRDTALERGVAIARAWAELSPRALAATKRLFYEVAELPLEDAMAAGREVNTLMRGFREPA